MVPGVRSVLAAGFLAGLAAADPPAPRLSGPPIDELVRDLGDDSQAVRDRATKELWKRGKAAIPALEKAAADPDPEVARRAAGVLDTFSWGLFPDTPPAAVALIRRFQAGDATEKKEAVAGLLKLGGPGRESVAALLRKSFPKEIRDPLVSHLTALLRREVPILLFDGKTDEAAELLALHAAGTTPEGAADHAALQLLRGTLPAAITAAETARAAGRDPAAADLVLAHLYRANRDWAKARAAAARFPRQPNGSSLVEMLLEEQRDWPALADTALVGRVNMPDALRLTFLRLSGRTEKFDEAAKSVRRSAEEFGTRDDVREAAFALLLNHRAADATDLLLAKRQNLGLLSEILIARLRYRDALDLLTGPPKPGERIDDFERLDSDLRRARVLAATGKRDEAVVLFKAVAVGLRDLPPRDAEFDDTARSQTRRALLRSETRVGLADLAAEHAVMFLPTGDPEDAGRGETVFEVMFGPDAAAAETTFRHLRAAKPNDHPRLVMIRTRELLAGVAPKEAVDEAVKALAAEGVGEQPRRTEIDSASAARRLNRLLALAAVCRWAGRTADAERAFAAALAAAEEGATVAGPRSWVYGTSDGARPWVESGDFLHDLGRFADAAARFEAGWRKAPDQPLLLFLCGRSLVKAGEVQEGRRRMELAHWVALGNERVRGKFLEELVRRGEAAASRRETDLLLRACWCRDFYFGNVMNQAARAAVLNEDFPTAELCVQRTLLVLMRVIDVHFTDTASYFTAPHDMLVYRARGLLAAGKTDEAVAAAREVLAVTPGHVELVCGMVPALEKAGRKKDADELFAVAWSAYRKVLAEYPDGPSARVSLATLAAGCRRELDAGLRYAKEAAEADPKSVATREALAEVLFRRGDRAAAVAVMETLAAEAPRNRLYQRQLTRYRSGALDSPIPEAAAG